MISPEAVAWAKPHISRILGIPVQDSEVESILAIENDEAICRHLAAFSENTSAYIEATDFVQNYRKTFSHGVKNTAANLTVQQKKAKVTYREARSVVSYQNEDDTDLLFQESLLEGMTIQAPRSLMSGPGKSGLARKICGCMGLDHDLSRNCISCGRVMCVLEAVDTACVECGFGANQKIDKKIFQEYKEAPGYAEAVAVMQKLLGFDKDGAARTRVYDTHTDFYEEKHNPWCTESERQLSAAYADRQEAVYDDPTKLLATNACLKVDLEKMKLSMSDAQQNFLEQQNSALKKYVEQERHHVEEASAQMRAKVDADPIKTSSNKAQEVEDSWILEPTQVVTHGDAKLLKLHDNWRPAVNAPIDDTDNNEVPEPETTTPPPAAEYDEEFTKTEVKLSQDRGVCLTLHQPWASLIVYGLKRIEGRIWTTDFRGRLWIHAATTEPTPEQIEHMESYYENVYQDASTRPKFPPNYPTRCLVGCVDLIDIAQSHKGLWDKYPWVVEVNDCPYKWILKNPQRLVTPIPMPGEHKLWQLHKPSVYHRALMTSKYYRVIPSHIDNQDPLTLNKEVIEKIMATGDAGTVDTETPTSGPPWIVRERYCALRSELLCNVQPDAIVISTRKPLNINNSFVGLNGVLDPEALKKFCGALVLSIERAFTDDEAWSSSIGDPNDKIRQHVESLWSEENVFVTNKIHPAIREAAETLLSQAGIDRKFSLGGPHIPPVDVLEFYLRPAMPDEADDHPEGDEDSDDEEDEPVTEELLKSTGGEPIILIGTSGTHVLSLGESSEVFVGAGDVLILHKKNSLRKLHFVRAFIADFDDPLVAQCALCVLRCNLSLC